MADGRVSVQEVRRVAALVWLEWPEACFRATADDVAHLEKLVGGKVMWVHSRTDFVRLLPSATHAITWHFEKDWYGLSPSLRVLATPAAGREFIAWRDAPAGVTVHFGAFHGAIIAESVAAFCLGWARGFFRKPPTTDGGGMWPRTWLGDKCFTVAGTKAVIAGYGRIGRAIGEKLAALGVSVAGFGRGNIAEMPAAMADADWFVMALPGDTQTDGFLDSGRIAMLPRRCAVVNVGRGNAIDETALRSALMEGRIAAAYLDVFRNEPTLLSGGLGDSSGGCGLWNQATAPGSLIAMPHSSAFSPDYVRRCFDELASVGLLA